MDHSTSIFLLYVFIMLIIAFMLRSLLPSPHYYGILIMVSILVFIIIYPIPNIYSAAEYSIVKRPMYDRFDELEWNNEKQSNNPSEPTMQIVPKPLIISTH
jgi:ABC-type transport system involved in multi-copper enzyme maturation permease subunit